MDKRDGVKRTSGTGAHLICSLLTDPSKTGKSLFICEESPPVVLSFTSLSKKEESERMVSQTFLKSK